MTSRWSGAGVVALTATLTTCALFLFGRTAPAGGSSAEPSSTTTIATTTTTPTTTTTTTTPTSTTTSTTALRPTLVPSRVAASTAQVGLGGIVTFDGSCVDHHEPVVAWITDEHRGTTSAVDTGLATSPWTFVWTAPTHERDVASFVFRFWCGDPSTLDGDHPGAPGIRVAMVAGAAPSDPPAVAPTHPSAAPESPPLPETG